MSFQPVVPFSGLPGWRFLNATLEQQSSILSRSPAMLRDTDYFERRIPEISSAQDLTSERRLLRVALGAFGLQEDINSQFFIRKILEEGTKAPEALANRLSDARYKEFAGAFGFAGDADPQTQAAGFGRRITELYRERAFETAVGQQDLSLRLAMNARRELGGIASQPDTAEDTKWFRIMGTPPLRKVFETALGLPEAFGQLDLDRQLETFKEKAQSQLGLSTLADLSDDGALENLVERFLLRDQVRNTSFGLSSGSIALTLLSATAQA